MLKILNDFDFIPFRLLQAHTEQVENAKSSLLWAMKHRAERRKKQNIHRNTRHTFLKDLENKTIFNNFFEKLMNDECVGAN